MAEVLEIACPKCGANYQISPDLAGHRVQCTACLESFEAGREADERDPRGRQWRFRMPGGQRFGPLSKPELDEYVAEGVLTADCQVHRAGDDVWRWAGEVYPDVPGFQSERAHEAAPTASYCGGLPAAGLLERVPSIRASLPGEHARAHDLLDARAAEEAKRSALGVRRLGSRSVGLVGSAAFGRQFAENFGAILPARQNMRVNSLAVVGMAAGAEEYYLVVPYSQLEPLPHEFFALLPGELPAALVLQAAEAGGQGVWRGDLRGSAGAVGAAMAEIDSPLGQGANWKWVSKDRKLKRQLDWVIQLVPLGCEQFVLIAQTAGIGRKGKLLGVDWFLEQIHHARRLRAKLNLPGNCDAHFPVHSESAELLARMFGD